MVLRVMKTSSGFQLLETINFINWEKIIAEIPENLITIFLIKQVLCKHSCSFLKSSEPLLMVLMDTLCLWTLTLQMILLMSFFAA